MKEEWKNIKGYENLYEISNFGNVRNKDKKIIKLEYKLNERGYGTGNLTKWEITDQKNQ